MQPCSYKTISSEVKHLAVGRWHSTCQGWWLRRMSTMPQSLMTPQVPSAADCHPVTCSCNSPDQCSTWTLITQHCACICNSSVQRYHDIATDAMSLWHAGSMLHRISLASPQAGNRQAQLAHNFCLSQHGRNFDSAMQAVGKSATSTLTADGTQEKRAGVWACLNTATTHCACATGEL